MPLLALPILQIPEQVPTTVVGIVGLLAFMITTAVGVGIRGILKNVAKTQQADIEMRQAAATEDIEDKRANRAALMQIVGFMAALNEQVRAIQGDILRAALREPISVKISQPQNDPIPTRPVTEPGEGKP